MTHTGQRSKTNSVLQEILTSRTVRDGDGNEYPLTDHISHQEGMALRQIIREHDLSPSIEVGLAYGISALYICDALSQTAAPRHVCIDPHQTEQWHDIGTQNLDRAGYAPFTEVIQQPSEIALPELLANDAAFEFGLIDGWHTFDHTLVDFFYINRLLNVGGFVAIDDLHMPGVNKAVRYILNYPAYETVELLPPRQRSWQRNLMNRVGDLLPRSLSGTVFDDSLLRSDADLGIQGSMAILRKVDNDDRSFDWYHPF